MKKIKNLVIIVILSHKINQNDSSMLMIIISIHDTVRGTWWSHKSEIPAFTQWDWDSDQIRK